jgi:alpha-L-fucosidase
MTIPAEVREVIGRGPHTDDWASFADYPVPGWYQDGKFGIFVHWGAYSVPGFGNEWYPRNMYRPGSPEYQHHREVYGDQRSFGYKDFIDRFTGEAFDPQPWAEAFRQAGARFVVPVGEHHDGFAMYPSARTGWTAAARGPRRDVLGELAAAVRGQDMVFGVSSHRAENWWFFNGGMSFPSDVRDRAWAALYGPAQPEGSAPTPDFLQDWLLRACELADLYRPQLMWFDTFIEHPAFQPYLRAFAAYYYNRAAAWGQQVAINYKNRAFPAGTAVFDVERGQLGDLATRFWQTDTAVANNSWGYVSDPDYKDPAAILGDLVDIVSKNGALLLNVGPAPDGTLPPGDRRILAAIGRWLAVNGEAVYGTRPWRSYGEGPTAVREGSFQDTKRDAFTPDDIRYTTRDGLLYAVLLARPDPGPRRLHALSPATDGSRPLVSSVSLLGRTVRLRWHQDRGGLEVSLPAAALTGLPDGPVALKIELAPGAGFTSDDRSMP